MKRQELAAQNASAMRAADLTLIAILSEDAQNIRDNQKPQTQFEKSCCGSKNLTLLKPVNNVESYYRDMAEKAYA